jgi:diguanylate cyclase (GGDEF)-like protein
MKLFLAPMPPANEAERIGFLHSCEILDTAKDERFDRVTRLAAAFYEADAAFIGFVDDRYQWMKSVTGDKVGPWVRREQSVCQIVIATGEPLIVGDMKSDERLKGHPLVPHLPFRFYAGVPLLTGDGAAVASLCILKHEAQDENSFNPLPLVDLAAIAVDELELWRHNRDLARLAETDGLTGLTNRRGFDIALDRAVQRAKRVEQPLSLLLLDLDHFKALNDTLGHQGGDEVLKRFGFVLSAVADRNDMTVARYGGEEFALILPDTDAVGSEKIARRIQEALASAMIAHPRGINGLVTASIGVATAHAGTLSRPDALIEQADTALYRAKSAGRNRIAAYS